MPLTSTEKRSLSTTGIHTGYKTIGEYRIYLEWSNGYQIIKFRIEETTLGEFEFSQSHYIKTPDQASQYITSRTSEDSPEAALERVVDTIMSYYNDAIKVGHKPSNAWFKLNKDF
jgi:hypothetical protein